MIEGKGWYTLEFRKNGGIHILDPDLGSIYVSRDVNLKKASMVIGGGNQSQVNTWYEFYDGGL